MVKGVNVVVWCVVLMVAAAHVRQTTAAAPNCNPSELRSCAPALSTGEKPTAECCEKLKEQRPCFCQYVKDPLLKPIITGPNAKKIAAACSVQPPPCPQS